MTDETKEPLKPKKAWFSDALLMFSRLSVWIAVPVILASLLGKYLDSKYGTEPWLLITCVVVSFIFTMIGLVKETTKAFKKIEEEEAQKKKK